MRKRRRTRQRVRSGHRAHRAAENAGISGASGIENNVVEQTGHVASIN